MIQIKIHYVHGGRNSLRNFTLNYALANGPALDSDDMTTYAQRVTNTLASALTSEMEITRFTASQEVVPGSGPAKRPYVLSIKDLKGKRAVAQGDRTVSLEHILLFDKRVQPGVPGPLEIRGALLDSEIDTSGEGVLAFKNNVQPAFIAGFAKDLYGAMTSSSAVVSLPLKTGEASRPVRELLFNKVGSRQLTQHRKSPDAKIKSALKGMMAVLNRDFVDAKYSRSTGAANDIDPAQQREFDARAKLILGYANINKLLKIGVPKLIQPLMKSNA